MKWNFRRLNIMHNTCTWINAFIEVFCFNLNNVSCKNNSSNRPKADLRLDFYCFYQYITQAVKFEWNWKCCSASTVNLLNAIPPRTMHMSSLEWQITQSTWSDELSRLSSGSELVYDFTLQRICHLHCFYLVRLLTRGFNKIKYTVTSSCPGIWI